MQNKQASGELDDVNGLALSDDKTKVTGKKPHIHRLSMIIVGNNGVGKSSIMQRYVKKEYNPNCLETIGVDFMQSDMTT